MWQPQRSGCLAMRHGSNRQRSHERAGRLARRPGSIWQPRASQAPGGANCLDLAATNDPGVWLALAGSTFGVFVAIISVLTMISMALAGILASSRFLFAMARDKLISPRLEAMNSKYETPHWAILVTGLAMGMAILLLPLKDVVKLASGFKIMIFIMTRA